MAEGLFEMAALVCCFCKSVLFRLDEMVLCLHEDILNCYASAHAASDIANQCHLFLLYSNSCCQMGHL